MTIRATWAFNGESKVILGTWHRLWCFIFGPPGRVGLWLFSRFTGFVLSFFGVF
ncbi:hypothetical protein SAMN04488527_11778 [Aliiroseovarius crassostreae]|nr:hypothetical protein SAMN04488527_11778 [Aliiroseovarius crassostreae]